MSKEALKRAFVAGFATARDYGTSEDAFNEWYDSQVSFVTGEHHAQVPNERAKQIVDDWPDITRADILKAHRK